MGALFEVDGEAVAGSSGGKVVELKLSIVFLGALPGGGEEEVLPDSWRRRSGRSVLSVMLLTTAG